MKKEFMWRIKYVKLLEILRQESDVDRPLATNDLLKKLQERDVYVDRKVLYDDIKILNEAGYEIVCERKKQNEYYILDRQFDIPELRVLMDAVEAATFISEKKTEELLDKIADLGGSYRKKLMLRNNSYFDTNKHSNPVIYYSINEIEEAINRDKKLTFKYFDIDYKGKKVYRTKEGVARTYFVNPVATIYSNENYYLVCFNRKYESFTNYRIDRMEDTRMLDEERAQSKALKGFALGSYRKKHFGMFTGKTEKVTLEFDEKLVEVIFDKFGESTKIMHCKDTYMATVEVAISEQFFGFITGLGDRIRITAPQGTVDEYKAHLDKIREKY